MTLNESINLKPVVRYYDSQVFLADLRWSWQGTCNEIVEGLLEKNGHEVSFHNGRVLIWREGGYAPQFYEIGKGKFLCPYWGNKLPLPSHCNTRR